MHKQQILTDNSINGQAYQYKTSWHYNNIHNDLLKTPCHGKNNSFKPDKLANITTGRVCTQDNNMIGYTYVYNLYTNILRVEK